MVSVYLYIPNIIDYFRVISLLTSFLFYNDDPFTFIVVYFISFSLDLFDGMAARHFKQFSRYGSALDMIIDRLTTASLLMICGKMNPEYFVVFMLLVLLDFGSHFLQVFSSLLLISQDSSIVNHKSVKERFWFMEIYYHNKYVLFTMCLFAELFLLMFYLNSFVHLDWLMQESIYSFFYYVSFVIYSSKQFISLVQIIGASDRIIFIDDKERASK